MKSAIQSSHQYSGSPNPANPAVTHLTFCSERRSSRQAVLFDYGKLTAPIPPFERLKYMHAILFNHGSFPMN
jgi:hypothetical protein